MIVHSQSAFYHLTRELISSLHEPRPDLASDPQPKAAGTQPCKFFNSLTGCRHENCPFLHVHALPPMAIPIDRPRGWRTRVCRHWLEGRCYLGDACGFAHVPLGDDLPREASRADQELPAFQKTSTAQEGSSKDEQAAAEAEDDDDEEDDVEIVGVLPSRGALD